MPEPTLAGRGKTAIDPNLAALIGGDDPDSLKRAARVLNREFGAKIRMSGRTRGQMARDVLKAMDVASSKAEEAVSAGALADKVTSTLGSTYDEFRLGKNVSPVDTLDQILGDLPEAQKAAVLRRVLPDSARVSQGDTLADLSHDVHRYFDSKALKRQMAAEDLVGAVTPSTAFARDAVNPPVKGPGVYKGEIPASRALVKYAPPPTPPSTEAARAVSDVIREGEGVSGPGVFKGAIPANRAMVPYKAAETAVEGVGTNGRAVAAGRLGKLLTGPVGKGVLKWGGRAFTALAVLDLARRLGDATAGQDQRRRAYQGALGDDVNQASALGFEEASSKETERALTSIEGNRRAMARADTLGQGSRDQFELGMMLASEKQALLETAVREPASDEEYRLLMRQLL